MNKLFSLLCVVAFAIELIGCMDHALVSEDILFAEKTAIESAKELFEEEFSISDIKYNSELEIYDVLMLSKEHDIQVWCQVSNDSPTKKSNCNKVITTVSSELMNYKIVLPEIEDIRQIQAQILLIARSMTYTGNIAIVSDEYDKKNQKYSLEVITESGDRLNFEADMFTGNIRQITQEND